MTQGERQLLLAVKLLAEAVEMSVDLHGPPRGSIKAKLDQVHALYALAVGEPGRTSTVLTPCADYWATPVDK